MLGASLIAGVFIPSIDAPYARGRIYGRDRSNRCAGPTMAFHTRGSCTTWGTGPLGTLGDGCADDNAEWATATLLTLTCVAVISRGAGPVANRVAGALLSATCGYRVLFGIGDVEVAVDAGVEGNILHGVVLGIFSTREFTVLALTWAATVTATCCGDVPRCLRLAPWVYCGRAGLCAAAAHSEGLDMNGMFMAFDAVGVVLGAAVFRASVS